MSAPTRRRAPAALAAAAAALGLLTGCSSGGDGTPATPASSSPSAAVGTAAVITRIPADDPLSAAVTRAAAGSGVSMSAGPDGALLIAVPGRIARLTRKSGLTAATGTPLGATTGVVGLPDGFVTASGGRLLRVAQGRKPQTIAGRPGAPRALTAPPPAGGPAASVRFTADLTPVGSLSDGSLILADGNVVWRLAAGTVTPLYRGDVRDRAAAVTPDGTLYLVPRGTGATLGGVRVLAPGARTPTPLRLPAAVPGLPGDPRALTPVAVTGDRADGVYVHVRRGPAAHPTGDWLLHLAGGHTAVTLASTAPATTDCPVTTPVSPTAFPCALPLAATSQPGLLVMAGGTGYVVGLRTRS